MHLRDRAHRWAALTIASVVLGATPVVALGASSGPPAGAATVSHFLGTLTVSPTSLSFGEATLGTFVGPMKFTMTNGSASVDTVSFVPTGPAANDYHGVLESNCPQLGANSVVNLSDTFNSRASVSLTGIGGIGYYQVDNQGTVAYAGDAGFFGDASKTALNKPIVGMAATADGGGYWLVASDGGIFTYGTAPFLGAGTGLGLGPVAADGGPTAQAASDQPALRHDVTQPGWLRSGAGDRAQVRRTLSRSANPTAGRSCRRPRRR